MVRFPRLWLQVVPELELVVGLHWSEELGRRASSTALKSPLKFALVI